MTGQFVHAVRSGAATFAGILVSAVVAHAAEAADTFAVVSDIHLNPFDPPELAKTLAETPAEGWPTIFASIKEQAMSSWGSDTNYALLASSLAALAKTAAQSDFAIVSGDFLAHEFEKKAADALGVAQTDDLVDKLAVDTTIFVGDSLARALPGKPVFVTLGNNDSACGDYEITPGGRYLAGTTDMVRRLAGADLVAPDFDRTYRAGGYYAVRHPGHSGTLILVINDVLWSAKYRDACGSGGDAAGDAMMKWLRDRLASQAAAAGSVWLVHHIPWGIDPFSTAHSKAKTCEAKVVPFLRERFATEFVELLGEYAPTIRASFSGHIHTDDYRLLVDEARPLVAQKIVSAISPIFGQNPGFDIVAYDPGSGAPTDLSTYYLANLDSASLTVAGDWRFEYAFSNAYGIAEYSTEAVAKLADEVTTGGDAADTYRRLYQVAHGELPEKDLPAYACAIAHLDTGGFTKCYCGG